MKNGILKKIGIEGQALLSQRLLWCFLAFLSGILAYFGNLSGPMVMGVFGLLGLVGVLFFRARLWAQVLSFVVLFFCLGNLWTEGRTQMLRHPVLAKPLFQTVIEGTVENLTLLPNQQIIDVGHIHWARPDLSHPERVRLYATSLKTDLQAGDRLQLKVNLFPPRSVQAPFQTSAARRYYFEQIGAVGHILSVQSVQSSHQHPSVFENLRQKIIHRLFEILPESQARIAVPLITGEQRFVAPEQYRIYRQSGITHVLSVSGFHMALLAGFLFFIVRGLLSLCGSLSLYINSKKVAAVVALAGTWGYLALSRFQIPAVRSFGMIALVFLGILTNRQAFSMRSLILVGFFILFLWPESAISISFQLSFLSVLILIATHEMCQVRFKNYTSSVCILLEFLTLNLSINVGLLPLILWHFNQLNVYGLLGNMLFSCVFSLGIMPLLFVGCLLMPLGWDVGFFTVAGDLLQVVEKMARMIARWPMSEILLPSFSVWALCLIILGIIGVCLWHKKGVRLGILLWLAGGIGIWMTDYPRLLVGDQGQTIAYIQNHTFYQKAWGRPWLLSQWQRKLGYAQAQTIELPDVLNLDGVRIAFKPQGCAGADFAMLRHRDSRCHIPTFISDDNRVYQVFIHSQKIWVQPVE